jgi:ABC-type nitrate/sulfonate/bicarbonate transport system substrate-binding protein
VWIGVCVVLVALSGAGPGRAQQSLPPLGTLEVAIAAPSPTTVPLWVAVAAHLDVAHGLRVTTITMAGGTESIQALVSGNAQAAHVGLSPVFLANAGGFHVVMIAADAIRSPFILYSRPGITAVAQLARGRVAISKVGSESDVLTRLVLARHGLDIRNIYFLQMGASGQRIAGLQSGATDAAVLLSPVTVQADKAGFHRLVDYSQEFPWVFDGIAVDRGYAAQHPSQVQALVAAYVEGMYYTIAHPDVAMDAIR